MHLEDSAQVPGKAEPLGLTGPYYIRPHYQDWEVRKDISSVEVAKQRNSS